MDKLIITATVDSSISWPGNPYMPPIEDTAASASSTSMRSTRGASVCHHHGVHHLEDKIQPDGRRLSRIDFDGWQDLTDIIKAAEASRSSSTGSRRPACRRRSSS